MSWWVQWTILKRPSREDFSLRLLNRFWSLHYATTNSRKAPSNHFRHKTHLSLRCFSLKARWRRFCRLNLSHSNASLFLAIPDIITFDFYFLSSFSHPTVETFIISACPVNDRWMRFILCSSNFFIACLMDGFEATHLQSKRVAVRCFFCALKHLPNQFPILIILTTSKELWSSFRKERFGLDVREV